MPAGERGGHNALISALRSVTAARPVVPSTGHPRSGPLAALCGWAALLSIVGLAVGLRGLFVILAGHAPTWFKPTLILLGIGGVALSAGAFLTVKRVILPWLFLAAASAVLIVSVVLSVVA